MNKWAMWLASLSSSPNSVSVNIYDVLAVLTVLQQPLPNAFVDRHMGIMVLGFVARVIRDVQVDRVVS